MMNIYLSPTDQTKTLKTILPRVNQMIRPITTTTVQNVPLINLLTQQIKSQDPKDQFLWLIPPLPELFCLSYERNFKNDVHNINDINLFASQFF